MNSHDAFANDMWWLLQAIRKEQLSCPNAIEFELGTGENVPNISTQRNMLRCLRDWRILHFLPEFSADSMNLPSHFFIKCDSRRFGDICKLFENGFRTGVEGEKIYDLAQTIFGRTFRLAFTAESFKKEFEAWLIINGKYLGTKKLEFKSGVPTKPIIELPVGTRWEDIKIRFSSRFEIDVLVNDKKVKSTNNLELGFFKSSTKERGPDKQWQMLHSLGMIEAVAEQQKRDIPTTIKDFSQEFGRDSNVMTIKKKLSQHLQAVFGLKDDPFEDYKIFKRYKTKFKLMPEPDMRHDSPYEFGQSYNDNRAYRDTVDENTDDIA